MSQHTRNCLRPALCSLAVLFGAVVVSGGQGGYELRCRGGAGAFAIDRLDASTLSLNFSVSARPAGADGQGLEPGTCSWIDRVVNDAEPRS